jgi:hypothetical protein
MDPAELEKAERNVTTAPRIVIVEPSRKQDSSGELRSERPSRTTRRVSNDEIRPMQDTVPIEYRTL